MSAQGAVEALGQLGIPTGQFKGVEVQGALSVPCEAYLVDPWGKPLPHVEGMLWTPRSGKYSGVGFVVAEEDNDRYWVEGETRPFEVCFQGEQIRRYLRWWRARPCFLMTLMAESRSCFVDGRLRALWPAKKHHKHHFWDSAYWETIITEARLLDTEFLSENDLRDMIYNMDRLLNATEPQAALARSYLENWIRSKNL